MTARHPRFEVVRTDAGWHARFRASNGQVVWTTESYTRRRAALAATRTLVDALTGGHWFRDNSDAYHVEVFMHPVTVIETLEVDERPVLPADLTDAVALGAWAACQPAVRKAIREGKKIHAIKELRALTGASLLSSKQAIEQVMP